MPSNDELCAAVCQVRSMRRTQMWFSMGCVSQPQGDAAHTVDSMFLWMYLFHADQIGKLMNSDQRRRISKQVNTYHRRNCCMKEKHQKKDVLHLGFRHLGEKIKDIKTYGNYFWRYIYNLSIISVTNCCSGLPIVTSSALFIFSYSSFSLQFT